MLFDTVVYTRTYKYFLSLKTIVNEVFLSFWKIIRTINRRIYHRLTNCPPPSPCRDNKLISHSHCSRSGSVFYIRMAFVVSPVMSGRRQVPGPLFPARQKMTLITASLPADSIAIATQTPDTIKRERLCQYCSGSITARLRGAIISGLFYYQCLR